MPHIFIIIKLIVELNPGFNNNNQIPIAIIITKRTM